jgi:hypothetical protein
MTTESRPRDDGHVQKLWMNGAYPVDWRTAKIFFRAAPPDSAGAAMSPDSFVVRFACAAAMPRYNFTRFQKRFNTSTT